MTNKGSGWTAIVWGGLTLLFVARLFSIPGLIARHHQGILTQTFGPWFLWATTIAELAFAAAFTVKYTTLWLRERSAARQVQENVS